MFGDRQSSAGPAALESVTPLGPLTAAAARRPTLAQALQQAEQLDSWEDEGGASALPIATPRSSPATEVRFPAVEQGARRDVPTPLPAPPLQLKN
jgi:hypothetical protein